MTRTVDGTHPTPAKVHLVCDLAEIANGREVVSVSAGPYNDIIVLTKEASPSSGSSLPKRYRIHHQTSQWLNIINLPETEEVFSFVQPLGAESWVLARRNASGEEDTNAHVYASDGRWLRSFPAGDGIAALQTTSEGQIWIGYDAEGVAGDTPLGKEGLVCLREDGQPILRHRALVGLPPIAAIFALNVAYKDEVWCTYRERFPLVKLYRKQIDRVWDTPIPEARAFAVRRNLVLSAKGEEAPYKLSLVNLDTREKETISPVLEDGNPLEFSGVFGRSFRLYLQTEAKLYALDLNDLER